MRVAMRLFVALNLSPEMRERLAALQDRLRCHQADVSWVRAENIHVTLKFLGETEEKRLPRVRAALAEAAQGQAAFSLEVEGVGSFGGRVPRVIWVGVERGAEPLVRLAGRIESVLAQVGFPKERRGFSPHLSLGRVRSPRNAEALLAGLLEARAERFGTVRASSFELMQSEFRPSGSVYTVVDRFPLAAENDRGDGQGAPHAG